MRKATLTLILAVLLLAACGGAGDGDSPDSIATIVAATLEAESKAPGEESDAPAEDAQPTPDEEQAATGSIQGDLSYPSEGIPPLNVVAFAEDGQNWYMTLTEQNQTSYQLDGLPAGNYTVVAYVAGEDYGGGYSAAVPCGLTADCNDHSLLTVEVLAGEVTEGIDPADWYAEEDAFPANPAVVEGVGSISGSLSYPSEAIPAMNVVAYSVDDNNWQYVITNPNQGSYQIDGLPNGDYYVVAYPVGESEGAGYSAAVPCGLLASCNDHSLLPVSVQADEVTEGIDPGDWYAGPGAFPPNPVP